MTANTQTATELTTKDVPVYLDHEQHQQETL